MQSLNKTQMSHPSFILKVLSTLAFLARSVSPETPGFIENRKGQRIAKLSWVGGEFQMVGHSGWDLKDLMVSVIEECGNTLHVQWLKELTAHMMLKERLRKHKAGEQALRTFQLVQKDHLRTASELNIERLEDETATHSALYQARRAVKFVSQNPHMGKTLKGREAACEAIAWYRQAADLVNKRPDLGRLLESGDVQKFRQMAQVVGLDTITATEIILSNWRPVPKWSFQVFEFDDSMLRKRAMWQMLQGAHKGQLNGSTQA